MITENSLGETSLHEQALKLARQYRKTQALLISVLDEIDSCRLYRALGYPSLFAYAVSALDLSEATAYNLISVARKSREVLLLRAAVLAQEISVSKAAKITSVLDQNNAAEVIAFAKNHTSREIEAEVARRQRASAGEGDGAPEKQRSIAIPVALFEKLKRAKSVLSTKRGKNVDQSAALEAALEEFLERHDPVRRAERAMKRQKKKAERQTRENETDQASRKPADSSRERRRKRRTAEETHTVNARDGGRCMFVDANGKRCENDRHIHFHHKIPVSCGGSNDPDNLVSLCPFHHDLAHQLSFAIDGQVNWIGERGRAYH